MASDKRQMDDFYKFPGGINEEGWYQFPVVAHTDVMDRKRTWVIYVRLVKKGKKQRGVDWDHKKEKQVELLDDYFEMGAELPKDVIAQAWTETGIVDGKITINSPSYFEKLKNAGRANQRNQLQTALIYARDQYLKKRDTKSVKVVSGKTNVMYFPMLAETWAKASKHLEFPAYIQPKLDGARCLVWYDKDNDKVVVQSRTQKEFPDMEYLQEIIKPYLVDLYDEEEEQSIYLDGELYRHGERLQDISGRARRGQTKSRGFDKKSFNEFHIYDCFYPKELDTPFSERYEQVKELFKCLSGKKHKKYGVSAKDVLKLTPTYKIKTQKQGEKKFDEFVAKGYEGAIWRNADFPYLGSPTKKTGTRSKGLVKMKQRFTEEFEIVGYTQGKKGKDKGALIWIAKTTDGKKFNVTPKDMTYKERYEMFEKCEENFDQFKGKMLTVEYEDLSKDKVPQRAKALVIRDYE